jgi:hypothetical protein
MDFRLLLFPTLVLPLGLVTFVLTARAWQGLQAGLSLGTLPFTLQLLSILRGGIHEFFRSTTKQFAGSHRRWGG